MRLAEWGYRFEALLPDGFTPGRALYVILVSGFWLWLFSY